LGGRSYCEGAVVRSWDILRVGIGFKKLIMWNEIGTGGDGEWMEALELFVVVFRCRVNEILSVLIGLSDWE
jgi:hypothetical protein